MYSDQCFSVFLLSASSICCSVIYTVMQLGKDYDLANNGVYLTYPFVC